MVLMFTYLSITNLNMIGILICIYYNLFNIADLESYIGKV